MNKSFYFLHFGSFANLFATSFIKGLISNLCVVADNKEQALCHFARILSEITSEFSYVKQRENTIEVRDKKNNFYYFYIERYEYQLD